MKGHVKKQVKILIRQIIQRFNMVIVKTVKKPLANSNQLCYTKYRQKKKGSDSDMLNKFTGSDLDDMIYGDRDLKPSER